MGTLQKYYDDVNIISWETNGDGSMQAYSKKSN